MDLMYLISVASLPATRSVLFQKGDDIFYGCPESITLRLFRLVRFYIVVSFTIFITEDRTIKVAGLFNLCVSGGFLFKKRIVSKLKFHYRYITSIYILFSFVNELLEL